MDRRPSCDFQHGIVFDLAILLLKRLFQQSHHFIRMGIRGTKH